MYLGIDVGGTTIKFGVVTREGEIVFTERYDTLENTKKSADFIKLLIDVSKKIQEKYTVEGIGIGMPGMLSLNRHVLMEAANLPTLNGTNIYQPLKDAFPNLVISLENDANCAALGELYFGGHNLDNFTLMTLGTGVGGGVIIHRKLFIGAKGNAGEIGKIPVGPDRDKNIEDYIGQRNLVGYVLQELNKPENANSSLKNEEEITVEKVYNAAKAGDKFALSVFNFVGELIGEAMVSIIHLYDVSQVIIGGGVGKSFDLFYDAAIKKATSLLTPYYIQDMQLLPAGKNADTGLIGAAGLVLNKLETL